MSDGIENSARQTAYYAIPSDRPPYYRNWLRHWRDLLIVIRALHALVAARLPLAEGLLHMSQDAPNRALWHVFYWLHREIQGGVTLHDAMINRPGFFPAFCVDLVRAGEESGQLEAALDDLGNEIEDRLEFRHTLMWHACFIGSALLLPLPLVLGVMTFVVPQVAPLLDAMGGDWPRSMAIAITLHERGLFLLLFVTLLFTGGLLAAAEYSLIRGGWLAKAIGAAAGWTPLLGAHLLKRHLAADATILARLLDAGAPLPAALRSAAGASGSARCTACLLRLTAHVEAGTSLQESMSREGRTLPASFRTMVSIGEQNGQLPAALHQISAFYRDHTQYGARLALELGVPLAICLNGLLVFLVYSGVLTTIFRFASPAL